MAEVTEKADSSNYYRILGTNSNAGQELIKKRYLEKVKAFPPEKDPEEFKRIRKAYETLKNPVKRSLYDLEHKYQGRVKRLMDRASENLEFANLKKAQEQLEEAMELAPGNIQLKIFQAHLELVKNNEKGFYDIYNEIEEKAPGREIPDILLSKTQHLKEEGRPAQALKVLRVLEQQYPDKNELYNQFYKEIYYDLKDFNSLWETIGNMLPVQEEQSLEDIEIFIDRVNAVINFDKWEKLDIVKEEMMNFLNNIINKLDEEEESMLRNMLRMEFIEYGYYDRYKGQGVYLEFLEELDDAFLSEFGKEIRSHVQLNQEFEDMCEDVGLFPLVTFRVAELLLDNGVNESLSGKFIDEFSSELDYLEELDGEVVAGIIHLKNNYPHTYEYFQEEWQEIYQKRINHLKPDERKYYTRRIQDKNSSEYKQNDEGTIVRKTKKVGRNDPCPCGSGKKYKKCCGR